MTKKEKLFCRFYALGLNLKEAAAAAGFVKGAQKTAFALLDREDVRKEIRRSFKNAGTGEDNYISAGLKRLAFGSVSDAVKLIFTDREEVTGSFLEGLDLFNVSEIKFQKTGGIEIKFADRLKALTLLSELGERGEDDSALPFYKALERGAAALNGCGETDE